MITTTVLIIASLLQGSSAPRLLEKGAMSYIDSPTQVVARTAAEFDAIWMRHSPGRQQPRINFDHEMVVGVFVGSRNTAGYSVELVGADERQGALVVRYREVVPPKAAIVAQIITSPYFLAALPKYAGDVRFEKVE
jgi:PrcB C-terminal